jgi:hypothetical protein
MTRHLATAATVALTLGTAASAKPVARPVPRSGVAVISAGSEQALALGKTVISRPFGAQLVDRIAVVGSYRTKTGTFHLIRGEAAGACPARYLVVFAGAGAPVTGEPFGTCAAAARGAITRSGFLVTMPATVAGGPPVRFRYESGRMHLLDARPATGIASADGAVGFGARGASTCRTPTSADAGTQAAVIADFDRSYPAEYRKPSLLKRTEIEPDELRATVAGLACLSRWPGAERVVPQAAVPLFASKRYGPIAFRLIETIARDPSSDANLRAAVRAFGTEMIYRVDRRQPL